MVDSNVICYVYFFFNLAYNWTFTIIENNLQLTTFKFFIIDISDELTFAILSTLIVVIFAKAANTAGMYPQGRPV